MPSYQSNLSGLRIAEEVIGTPKTLPGTPIWEPVEPNSYKDFGSEVKTVARSPIASDRQNRKGVVVDVDASAGYTVDATTKSLLSSIQGFMFASWRKKAELVPTAVTGTQYTVAASGTNFEANSLLYAENYATAGNNGLKLVTASTGTSVSAAGLTAEAGPPSDAKITKVGFEFAAGDLTLTVTGTTAVIGATAKNLTQLGLIPGEWLWLGGDAAANRLATAASNGFYRVASVTATAITCDRIPDTAATDAGAGKTVRLFMGNAIKNEWDPTLQVFRTYQIERQYTSAVLEYVLGSAANKLKLDTKTADKLTADLEFVALDTDVTQVAAKAGTRPSVKPQTAFSSSTDFTRLRLLNDADATSLAVYLTDMSLEIDNGIEADKAIGTIGGVDFSFGNFMVSGSVEAYFSSMTAVSLVRSNATVSLDFGMVANVAFPGVGNVAQGILFDMPSVDLGDGRLKVEKDKKVKLPLNLSANAHATYNHTLMMVHFPYLPQLAL